MPEYILTLKIWGYCLRTHATPDLRTSLCGAPQASLKLFRELNPRQRCLRNGYSSMFSLSPRVQGTAHNNCGSGEYCYTVSGGGACSACHSNNVCAIYGNSIDGDCSACSSPSSPSSPPSSPSAAPVTALKAGLLSIVFSLIGAILVM